MEGVITQGLQAIDEVRLIGQRSLAELRRERIDGIMTAHSAVLAQDTFVGDPELALLHHFGTEVFEDPELLEPYQALIGRITRQECAVVPVLIDAADIDEMGQEYGRKTTLSIVSTDLTFKSSREREEGVRMHAHTNSTTGVTNRELAVTINPNSSRVVDNMVLCGTGQFQGSLLGPVGGESQRAMAITPGAELVLRKESTADEGRGNGMPSSYTFTDTVEELLQAERTPQVIVGWQELENVLLKRITVSGGGIREAIRLWRELESFRQSAVPPFNDLMRESAPHLTEVIDAVASLHGVITKNTET